jgi:transcription-repair coupling factor (superfamily II helicase)
VLLTAESLGRRETMVQFLQEHGIKPQLIDNWQDFANGNMPLALVVAPLYSGFAQQQPPLSIITESELYQHIARSHTRRRHVKMSSDSMLRDLAEVKSGDPVVHEQHGIGRYIGLVSMDLGEGETELMQLEYADNATLYVPVSQLHLISRYAGGPSEQAPLHKLGNPAWEKAKKRAPKKRATPPPSCLTSTPSAPRAKATASPCRTTITMPLPPVSALRKP